MFLVEFVRTGVRFSPPPPIINIMKIKIIITCIILLSLIFTAGAVILIMINSKENLVFFFTPTELINSHPKINSQIRIGGFVKNNSLKTNTKKKSLQFYNYR